VSALEDPDRSPQPARLPRFAPVELAVEALARGAMVIVVDSRDRENEGDLVIAAEHADSAAINFMATHGRGLICVPMEAERLAALDIPPMIRRNTDPHGTAFHVGVDAKHGTTTGISAHDRALAARVLASRDARPSDLTMPGHLFPLAAHPGGIEARRGHTEASVELVRAAGLQPAAVICEIADEDGAMARLPQLASLAARHGLLIVTVDDVADYASRSRELERVVSASMPCSGATFRAVGFRDHRDEREHVALVLGDLEGDDDPLVHVHSECLLGDVFGAAVCDCHSELESALDAIRSEGRGAVIYLRRLESERIDVQEWCGNHAPTHHVNHRDHEAAARVLHRLGADAIRLLTDRSHGRDLLEQHGVRVTECVVLNVPTRLTAIRQRSGRSLPRPLAAGSGLHLAD
jgi:3,4-dihydroxy 2-butanone 4-phosphate synthase/GTP cyclohydrolase II